MRIAVAFLRATVSLAISSNSAALAVAQDREWKVTASDLARCDVAPSSASRVWSTGAVFFRATARAPRSLQQVRAAWCAYLRDRDFGPFSVFSAWSAEQRSLSLFLDPGIEWARSNPVTFNATTIYFEVDSVGADAVSAQFSIRTTIIEQTPDSGQVIRATHNISAVVQNDSVVFESALVALAKTAKPYSTGSMLFFSLDGVPPDASRADSAWAFVKSVRARMHISARADDTIRYFFSSDEGQGVRALGFSLFTGEITGFTGVFGSPFIFSNLPEADVLHYHELAHAATKGMTPPPDTGDEEAVVRVLGGSRRRLWDAFLCEDSRFLFEREGVRSLGGLLRKRNAFRHQTSQAWVYAMLLNFAQQRAGDIVLIAALRGEIDRTSSTNQATSLAQFTGQSAEAFLDSAFDYYSSFSRTCAVRQPDAIH